MAGVCGAGESNFNKVIRLGLVWRLVKFPRKWIFMLVSALLMTSYVPVGEEYKFFVSYLLFR